MVDMPIELVILFLERQCPFKQRLQTMQFCNLIGAMLQCATAIDLENHFKIMQFGCGLRGPDIGHTGAPWLG